ncbi:3-dehydroquinate synthase [Opitutales bacterium]|nr:3-dehydroquinate synthase [Opitutales bacterium]
MEEITIELGVANYPLLVADSGIDATSKFIKEKYSGKRVLIISDSIVWEELGMKLLSNIEKDCSPEIYQLPGGKQNKTVATVLEILARMEKSNFSRDSLVLGLGGGVVGDIAGFVASLWYRGCDLVHVPTTMLSMVDSCLGGKTAINFRQTINGLGTYYHPKAIVIGTDFVSSLPAREVSSGFGEIIKYAFLGSKSIRQTLNTFDFDKLKEDVGKISTLISGSLMCKSSFVREDVYEGGQRLALNFGHTLGHALEMATVFEGRELLRHGEGVALGMRGVIEIGIAYYNADEKLLESLDIWCDKVGLPKTFDSSLCGMSASELTALCMRLIWKDKKRQHDGLRLVMVSDYGKWSIEKTNDSECLSYGYSKIIR